MRQVDTAAAVARVMRVLLTKHKEGRQREGTITSLKSPKLGPRSLSSGTPQDLSPKSPKMTDKCSLLEEFSECCDGDGSLHDDDELSLQETLPQIVQACHNSRLQLVNLAPRLLEESAHTSNSDVCNFLS